MSENQPVSREHGLDNLRVFVIILVVVLHASLSYMAFAPQWWYVLDPKRSLFFTGLVLLIDVPIMLIMFFLAGYFAYPSLARRGAAAFLKDKAIRIGIPWVFGSMVLAPPTAYLMYYSRHFPVSLGAFWAGDFWGKAYQQSVYWYLGVLFLFFALTALAFSLSRRFATWRPEPVQPSRALLLGFVLALSAISLALSLLHLSFDTWSHNYLLVYQPVRVPLYVGYFGLGIFARQRGWFTAGGYTPATGRWVSLCLVSGLAYLAWRLAVPPSVATLVAGKAATALLFNVFCFTSLIASVALFQSRFAQASPLWRSQARNSYGVYFLHPLVLYPLALLLVPFQVSIYLKAPAIILGAYLACWAASAAVLTRAPGLRRMF